MIKSEAIKVMAVLTAAYPRTEISEETIEIYAKFLLDLPFRASQAAALELIARSKWFPSVAELRQEAVKILSGDNIPTPGEAWGEVLKQFRFTGFYREPDFSHPAITKAVMAMGWVNLCASENMVADRAHFMRIYESYREREVREVLQLPEVRHLKAKIARELPLGRGQKTIQEKKYEYFDNNPPRILSDEEKKQIAKNMAKLKKGLLSVGKNIP